MVYSQVGIGTTLPNGALDIVSSDQGLLIPRVALNSLVSAAPVVNSNTGNPLIKSTLVYNTTANSIGVNSVSPGFYYWDGVKWVRLNSDINWSTTGNLYTNSAINFIGTLDNNDLVFKRNNVSSGRINETNTAFGVSALKLNASGVNNTAIGVSALENNSNGIQNTAIGKSSLMLNTSGSYNVSIGYSALERNTSGLLNTAVGHSSLYNNLIGKGNVAVGKSSLERNISGDDNTALGYNALYNNQTGSKNIGIGTSSLERNISGNNNIAIGNLSLYNNQSVSNCIAIGNNAQLNNMSGQYNISLGDETLVVNQTGNNNIAIGYNAFNTGNFSNSIAIGNNTVISSNDQVRIGNLSTTSIGGFTNWTNVSDMRFKKDINYNSVPGLDFILKLKPVTYKLDYKNIQRLIQSKTQHFPLKSIIQTGFIAQEVEKVANELNYDFSGVDVPKNEKDFYGIRYAEFVVPLTRAIQEQQQMIVSLQNELENLKLKLKTLESK